MAPTQGLHLSGWRDRLAFRAVRSAVARRQPATADRLPQRRILVTLPDDAEAMRDAWKFLQQIATPASHIHPVAWGGTVVYAPADFIGTVTVLDAADFRPLTRLPRLAKVEALWSHQPTIALNLRPTLDLNAAYLIGASPARLRIGFFDPLAEPFFDVLLDSTKGFHAGLQQLRAYLEHFDPPAVAFR